MEAPGIQEIDINIFKSLEVHLECENVVVDFDFLNETLTLTIFGKDQIEGALRQIDVRGTVNEDENTEKGNVQDDEQQCEQGRSAGEKDIQLDKNVNTEYQNDRDENNKDHWSNLEKDIQGNSDGKTHTEMIRKEISENINDANNTQAMKEDVKEEEQTKEGLEKEEEQTKEGVENDLSTKEMSVDKEINPEALAGSEGKSRENQKASDDNKDMTEDKNDKEQDDEQPSTSGGMFPGFDLDFAKKLIKFSEMIATTMDPEGDGTPAVDHQRKTPNLEYVSRKTRTEYSAFECEFCGGTFKRFSALKSHREEHHTANREEEEEMEMKEEEPEIKEEADEKEFICPICDDVFASIKLLKVHKKSHIKKPKADTGPPYQCGKCKRCFRQKGNYETHLRLHHKVAKEPELKPQSHSIGSKKNKGAIDSAPKTRKGKRLLRSKETQQKSRAEENQLSKNDDSEVKEDLTDLKNEKDDDVVKADPVAQSDTLVKSEESKAKPEEKTEEQNNNKTESKKPKQSGRVFYTCLICIKTFVSRKLFKLHQRSHNSKKRSKKTKPRLQCDQCMKWFSCSGNYHNHLKVHAGIREFKCDDCGKAFYTKGHLKEHMRRHVKVKAVPCPECPKLFKCDKDLLLHMKFHTDVRPYKCTQCEKCFHLSTGLKTHISKHSDDRNFMCTVCGKKYKAKKSLDRHHMTHTGEKPYQCQICNQRFTQKSTLQVHVLTHTGEKPHVCHICGWKFTQKGSLTQHLRSHSKQEDQG